MQIIENFLPESVHKEYFEHYHSLNPVWRFVQKANSNADETGNAYFMNETYHDTWKEKDGSPFNQRGKLSNFWSIYQTDTLK